MYMLRDMTESQVREKLEALMFKYNVQDVYIHKWIKHPFDIQGGLDITVDGNFNDFLEDVCITFSDYDDGICTAAGPLPSVGNPIRERILQNMRLLYKDGKFVCQQER